MLNLQGKVALVAGVGSVGKGWGNGKATAVLLARQGAQVFGCDLHLASDEARYITAAHLVVDGGLTAARPG